MISEMPRRRWFRFSLRSLLLLITVLAIGLGWMANERNESQKQMRIADDLVDNGVVVEFVGLFDDESTAEQSWWRASLNRMLGPRVIGVYVERGPLDDFTPLVGPNDLRILQVLNSSVSDLSPLASLKNLRQLVLMHTKVRDLTPLAGLTELQSLDLRDSPIRDLMPLAGIKNLQQIKLRGDDVSDEQLRHFYEALPNCTVFR